jgi:YidC/Oxa1 family membrane protein insertase
LIAALIVVAILSRRAALRVAALAPASVGPAADQAALLARVAGVVPFLTVVAALFVPLAATLYLVVTSAWSLVERSLLRRHVTG